MDALLELAQMLTPVLAGIISVPIFAAVKKVLKWVDGQRAAVQQMLVVVQTWGLAQLSNLDVIAGQLPETLSGLTLDQTEALVASGIAFAVHAGQRAASGDKGNDADS